MSANYKKKSTHTSMFLSYSRLNSPPHRPRHIAQSAGSRSPHSLHRRALGQDHPAGRLGAQIVNIVHVPRSIL